MRHTRHVAMGDPQAPLATVTQVLREHDLLAGDRLRPGVQLVSVGDHFDFGPPEARRLATDDGFALLSWLASHPPEQVVLLAGNHDLARVCELASFADDEAFVTARQAADAAWRRGDVDAALEAAFVARWPNMATAEALARDFSCFSVAQRDLVTGLLRARRLRLAHAHRGLLVLHAGVTGDDLASVGLAATDADAVARGLNDFLDARVDAWQAGPLDLEPLHQPGDATRGEGRGALFHRPADPAHGAPAHFVGPPRRRFDPRRLPAGFSQVIGHVGDEKCRGGMPDWSHGVTAPGAIRSLSVSGDEVRYQPGCAPDARLYLIDGAMGRVAASDYQLFDLDARRALSKPAS